MIVGVDDGRAGRVLAGQFERPVAIVGPARLQDAFVLAWPSSGHPRVQTDQSHSDNGVAVEDFPGMGEKPQRPEVDALNESAADLNELHAGQVRPLVAVDRLNPASESPDGPNVYQVDMPADATT